MSKSCKLLICPSTKQTSGTPVEKVGSEFLLPTAFSVASEKAFVVTWVAYCVCKKQKTFLCGFQQTLNRIHRPPM